MILLTVYIPLYNHILGKWEGSEIVDYCWENGELVNLSHNTRVGTVESKKRLIDLFEVNMNGQILEMIEG